MPVGALGPETVVTASPDDSVKQIAELLASENVGSIVITEDEKPVGIVTDRDIAVKLPNHDAIASEPVRSVMSHDPVTLGEDEEAMAISRAIRETHFRRFPVVDDQGKVTGIVTLDDLVATIGEQLDDVADTIAAQSPEYQP